MSLIGNHNQSWSVGRSLLGHHSAHVLGTGEQLENGVSVVTDTSSAECPCAGERQAGCQGNYSN